jgi:D-alanine-D-alanine ligase
MLVMMHESFVPPESVEGLSEKEVAPFKTEFDVTATLREMGHAARPLGVGDDLGVIRDAIRDFKPRIVFNLLGYLELIRQPYTGCNPHGLMFATNKALQKKILRFHRIPVPEFAMFPRGRKIRASRKLHYPMIVKSATAHGSVGIAQASIVNDEQKLRERVEFVHEQIHTDAIAEQFIDGRELYVGVIGNRRLMTLPIWELLFDNLPEGAPRIATSMAKWNHDYQTRAGVNTRAAQDLPDGLAARIIHLCKRAYRALGQTGYARMDLRLTPEGEAYLIESNPNPQLAYGEDFAESAEAAGLGYEALLRRIISLGWQASKD